MKIENMEEVMYRFRSTEKLIGEKFNELENQEIYFALLDELNDPMEGFHDIFWEGDSVLWTNLFDHYLYCLLNIHSLPQIIGKDQKIDDRFIPTLRSKKHFFTKQHTALIKATRSTFFSNPEIMDLIQYLSNQRKRVRRDELHSHLQFIHTFALSAIDINWYGSNSPFTEIINHKFKALELYKSIGGYAQFLRKCDVESKSFWQLYRQVIIDYEFQSTYRNPKVDDYNLLYVILSFTERYILKLETLIFPKCYTASFLSECKNSAVWGHYGNNHKGACLIYNTKTIDDSKVICLTGQYKSMEEIKFHEINYEPKFVEVDFFKSIGQIDRQQLEEDWFIDSDGNKSELFDFIKDNSREITTKYWNNFIKSTTTKTNDWKYENEYRLLLNDWFVEGANQKMKYDFLDLKGIIFGIKTSMDDKIKIKKIIDAKCESIGRTDFKYYQAYYSNSSGEIDKWEIFQF